jgi:hypothetical protein
MPRHQAAQKVNLCRLGITWVTDAKRGTPVAANTGKDAINHGNQIPAGGTRLM